MDDQDNYVESSSAQSTTAQKSSLGVPIAIILGFGLIAAAIYFSGGPTGAPVGNIVDQAGQNAENTQPESKPIRPVDENDHIRGNPNAPIVVVEYSDYDCPFCKNFHTTMNRIMDEYGASGKVAWVYRQFPLEQLHPNAPYIAAAAECAGKLGGNDAFWEFSDLVFNSRGTNEPTNTAKLGEYAVAAGVSESEFNSCLESGETESLVEEDFNDALNAGARGTPHSIVTFAGQEGVINGAQPYDVVKQIIDNLIDQTEE